MPHHWIRSMTLIPGLEVHFKAKLYPSRKVVLGKDVAKARGIECRIRSCELGSIESIEELRAELHFDALLDGDEFD